MKAEVVRKPKKPFEPVAILLTIESLEELANLYVRSSAGRIDLILERNPTLTERQKTLARDGEQGVHDPFYKALGEAWRENYESD